MNSHPSWQGAWEQASGLGTGAVTESLHLEAITTRKRETAHWDGMGF